MTTSNAPEEGNAVTQPATVFEVGAMTFGEITTDPRTGRTPSPQQRVQETIEQARTADQAGLDVFGIGEHHRSDFIASAPSVLLAGAATVTERVRLASTVTVLSSDDPVRVYEQFATLDPVSYTHLRAHET